MPRPPTGQIRIKELDDGRTSFALRVTIPATIPVPERESRRPRLFLGYDTDGWTEERARVELLDVRLHLARGIWPIPGQEQTPIGMTVIEHGRDMIRRNPDWSENTVRDFEWKLGHLASKFSRVTPDAVTRRMVQEFRAEKIEESRRLAAAIERGEPERGDDNRIQRPFAKSVGKFVATLAAVLDDALEVDEVGPGGDVARPVRRRHTKSGSKVGTWLEQDEMQLMIRAAAHLDRHPSWDGYLRGIEVVRLRDELELSWREVAIRTPRKGLAGGSTELGVALSTAKVLYDRICQAESVGTAEATITAMFAGGMRATETGAMNCADIDLRRGVLHVPGTKSDSAERGIEMSPKVRERMRLHFADRARVTPAAPAFPNANSDHRTRHSVRALVKRVAGRARAIADVEDLPFPSEVAPHDLRRTFAAVNLALGRDLAWVQAALGHKDARMTTELYNALQKRMDRSPFAVSFDRALFGDVDKPVNP